MMEVTASGLVTQRFLHGMQASQLDALAKTASEVIFPAGHRIFADGDYAARLAGSCSPAMSLWTC